MTDANVTGSAVHSSSYAYDKKHSPLPYLQIETENDLVSIDDVGDFIIGTIRNPFDFYVSFWAFSSTNSTDAMYRRIFTEAEQTELFGQDEPKGASEEDRARFRKWLSLVSTKDLGLMSLRFYAKYVDAGKESMDFEPNALYRKHWRRVHWVSDTVPSFVQAFPERQRHVNDALRRFSTAVANETCWVHTENVVEDTRRCLQAYEAETGSNAVDWRRFDAAIGNTNRVHTQHVACSDFYDDEAADLVLQGDSTIFRVFGYPAKAARAGE
eukprot:CAMPEP_0117578408 /NCGR_PEP_ID=MMETSP0784-20121206/63988_1 /TAXON_ID=39447 /ORGANISM="" /LENGTH=268 /DNA_ID=CAMNT_0005378071 /DNA_START=252 /DNA_END=1056 /DNA_ORIENTATION=+